MFNNKLDLFEQSWLDTVFAGRNKAYGAYDLRRRDAGITVKSTIIGAVIFSVLISTPLIVKRISETIGFEPKTIDETITLVDLATLPPPPKEEIFQPPAPPVKEMQSIKDIKKFTPPEVAPEEEIVEAMAKQKDFDKAAAGSRDIKGDIGGEVVIDARPTDEKVDQQVVEGGDGIIDVKFVQIMPIFKGGEKAFIQWIANNLVNIQLDSNQELNMKFRFVIEKDGSLSDIETISDGGFPAIAQQAIRVLQKSPHWKPGINNGKPVRVSYMVPIIVRPPQ